MPIDKRKVDDLLARVRRDVDNGLLPSCQVALGHDGELVACETFGDATDATRYSIFSATKPFVAAVVWQLMAEGAIDISARVVDVIPEFATNGKDRITIEQVLLHTSGFPHAPLGPPLWATRTGRITKFQEWRLNWEPGTAYEYHATSAHWVLAEIIDRVTGGDYRDEVRTRIAEPLGLRVGLGEPPARQGEVADLILTGEQATPDELEAALGVRVMPATEVNDETVLRFNDPAVRSIGVPGGGAVARAADLALFYQALLHNPGELWAPDVLADATGNVRNRFRDPAFRIPANRTLGLIVAGDDGKSGERGLGRTVSARAFGHNGAGGQLAWGDPESGLSLGYVTNGFDRNVVREGRRGVAIASLAGACAG
jgi:CubicO group peptidase (beta-lactamase class C family)